MERVRLEDLCHIVVGRTPSRAEPRYWGGNHHWLSIADMTGQPEILQTKERLSDEGAAVMRDRIAAPGTVLLSFKLSIGKVSIARVPVFTNEAIAALPIRNKSRLDGSYLAHYLAHADLTGRADRAAMGNTLNIAKLRAIEVPVPPLPEQRRIASIIDRVQSISLRRLGYLHLLESLVDALHSKIMGLESDQSSSWPRLELRELGRVVTGQTPPGGETTVNPQDLPFVTPGDLRDIDQIPTRFVQPEAVAASRVVRPGSLLVCCIGSIGNLRTFDRPVAFNQQINAVEWGDRVLPNYGEFAVSSITGLMQARASSTTVPIIKKSTFEQFAIPVPPLAIQRKFSGEVDQIRELRLRVKAASARSAVLRQSIVDDFFRGN